MSLSDIKVYKYETDEMVNVTQEWCNDALLAMSKLAKRNEIIKRISSLNIIYDANIIDEIHTILWKAK